MSKIYTWGGVLFLILTLVTGILLITLPAQGGENHQDKRHDAVTVAAADGVENIDGVAYQVFYLTADDARNRQIIAGNRDGNYKYVLTADWTLSAGNYPYLLGDAVILDLQGYTLTQFGYDADSSHGSYLSYRATTTEITDSAATHTGKITNTSAEPSLAVWSSRLILAGGNVTRRIHLHDAGQTTQVIVQGGNYAPDNGLNLLRTFDDATYTTYVAPWLTATYDGQGRLNTVSGYPANNLRYQTVLLGADYAVVKTQIAPKGTQENYLYVMTADLFINEACHAFGDAVIWDLNGCTLTVAGAVAGETYGYLVARSQTFTIADASPTQTGRVVCLSESDPVAVVAYDECQNIIIAGGTIDGNIHSNQQNTDNTVKVTITGGTFLGRLRSIYGNQITGTQMIDDVAYALIYLTGDYDTVRTQQLAPSTATGNYKYVLTHNLDLRVIKEAANERRDRRLLFYGNAVILDLKGYTITMSGWEKALDDGANYWSYFSVYCTTFAIADSSPTHTGKINSPERLADIAANTQQFILSGGNTVNQGLMRFFSAATQLVITGGTWRNLGAVDAVCPTDTDVAPYLDATYDRDGYVTSAVPYDRYAVSISDQYSGAYNYVYGLAWEIDVWALQKLTLSTNGYYYLWARNGTAWYGYLIACYVDDGWQRVAN